MKQLRHRSTVGVLALLAIFLVACGGGTATVVPAASVAPSASGSALPAASAAAPSAASGGATSAAPSAATSSAAPASAQASAPASGAASAPAASAAVGGTPAASGAATPAAAGERYKIVPDKSKATYKVGENFINQGNQYNLAEGSTGDVNGELVIDRTNPSKSIIGEIKVDISKLASDSERRDEQIRGGWLESTKFPTATFKTKRLEGMPTGPYTDGQELKFKIVGDMTIHNTTKELTFDATAKIVNGVLTGTAIAKFNMTDFGFDPPSILGVLKAENGVELVMTIEATRQP